MRVIQSFSRTRSGFFVFGFLLLLLSWSILSIVVFYKIETTPSDPIREQTNLIDTFFAESTISNSLDQWMSSNFPSTSVSVRIPMRDPGCTPRKCQPAFNDKTGLWIDHRSNRWGQRHHQQNQELMDPKQQCEYIFIGDSITIKWQQAQDVFDANFNSNHHNGVLYGHSGDIILDIGWRLKNGNGFQNMKHCLSRSRNNGETGNPNQNQNDLKIPIPKSMVLLIGTNNVGHGIPHDISLRDYQSLMHQFHEFLNDINDNTKQQLFKVTLYVMAIFPRGNTKTKGEWNTENQYFWNIQYMNEFLRSFVENQGNGNMRFVDCSHWLLSNITSVQYNEYQFTTGVIEERVMPDRLHLSSTGYRRWAECLKEHVQVTDNHVKL